MVTAELAVKRSKDEIPEALQNSRWIRIPAVMAATQLSRGAIYAAMDRGDLKFHKIGRSRRVSLSDLSAFMDSMRVSR